MYRECQALCDFVNEEIRKFSCAACLYIAHAEFKVNGKWVFWKFKKYFLINFLIKSTTRLEEATKKTIEMILQDHDTGVALLLMAELSDVLDMYKKPLFTRECLECVLNTMKGELICMLGK